RRSYLGLVYGGVELGQHLSALHARIEVRENVLDGSGNVGADWDGRQRIDRAGGLERGMDVAAFYRGGYVLWRARAGAIIIVAADQQNDDDCAEQVYLLVLCVRFT